MNKYILIFLLIIIIIFLIKKTEKFVGNEKIDFITDIYNKNLLTVNEIQNNKIITNNLNLERHTIYFPSKSIAMWSGELYNIPEGWYLCDGNNGTPDLRGRFILSYNDITRNDVCGNQITNRNLGNTGGTENHILNIDEIPKHKHNIGGDWPLDSGNPKTNKWDPNIKYKIRENNSSVEKDVYINYELDDENGNKIIQVSYDNKITWQQIDPNYEIQIYEYKFSNFPTIYYSLNSPLLLRLQKLFGGSLITTPKWYKINEIIQNKNLGGISDVTQIGANGNTTNTYETGNNKPHNNMPPFFVLAYIMKL